MDVYSNFYNAQQSSCVSPAAVQPPPTHRQRLKIKILAIIDDAGAEFYAFVDRERFVSATQIFASPWS